MGVFRRALRLATLFEVKKIFSEQEKKDNHIKKGVCLP